MISLSNIDVVDILRKFSNVGIDCVFLVPTKTGLDKSILDATESVRTFFKENNIHDYLNQLQGPNHKIVLNSLMISRREIIEIKTSLYRPETKNGDPRIWFSRLKDYADPHDLLALINNKNNLIIINCSKNDMDHLLFDQNSVFWKNYQKIHEHISPIANELLILLKDISSKGFIKTHRSGDTGVGYTLETLLGIKANSSKSPDYKGIEIKAGRSNSHITGRTTIFSQVPNWSISHLKSSLQLLNERGRFNELKKRKQLYHELVTTKINSYGLSLKLEENKNNLNQIFTENQIETIDVTWTFPKLLDRINEKHKQTFWVKAITDMKGSDEKFHYVSARYTSGVNPNKLPLLIETGVVSLDYTIKETKNGGAKDQGYLFKIRQKDLSLLFKSPIDFNLTK